MPSLVNTRAFIFTSMCTRMTYLHGAVECLRVVDQQMVVVTRVPEAQPVVSPGCEPVQTIWSGQDAGHSAIMSHCCCGFLPGSTIPGSLPEPFHGRIDKHNQNMRFDLCQS